MKSSARTNVPIPLIVLSTLKFIAVAMTGLVLTSLILTFGPQVAFASEFVTPIQSGQSLVSVVSARFPQFDLQVKTYDLQNSRSLSYFQEDVALILAISQNPETPSKNQALAKSGGKRMALEASLAWAGQLSRGGLSAPARSQLIAQIQETMVSFDSNYLSPEPISGDIVNISSYFDRPIALGGSLPKNLDRRLEATSTVSAYDYGRLSPLPSTFWTAPQALSRYDFYSGYGRTKPTSAPQQACTYLEKKGGYGTNGGFSIKCGDSKFKAKWGSETRVEPFNSRIVRALGFDTKISDYWPSVWVKYDRRIFSEYNDRDDLSVRVSFLAIPMGHLRIFRHLDPFATVSVVRMKNGALVNGAALKQYLLKKSARDEAKDKASGDETKDANYNLDFENQIDTLLFKELSVQIPEKEFENVGGWGWEDLGFYKDNLRLPGSSLGHEDRRELRGFGVLAAWLGIYDMRWDNNKLRLRRLKNGSYEIRHAITDLGSGLGSASSLVHLKNSDVNAFPWVFTKSNPCTPALGSSACLPTQFQITGYVTADHNQTFANITADDARWMASWIAQLGHDQIVAALATSGFNQAEIYLYSRKLEVRRDQLLRDLGMLQLSNQFSPQVASHFVSLLNSQNVGEVLGKENRNFELQPLRVQLPSGGEILPKTSACRLEQGRMKCGTP